MRGIKKNMIVLRRPDSHLFEEAYFIVREEKQDVGEGDLLAEANRILEKNALLSPQKSPLSPAFFMTLAFLAGGVFGCGITLFCTVI